MAYVNRLTEHASAQMDLMATTAVVVSMVPHAYKTVALDASIMNATFGTGVVLRVKRDITVHDVAIDVDRPVLNVQPIITVRFVNLDIGDTIVRRHVAVAV